MNNSLGDIDRLYIEVGRRISTTRSALTITQGELATAVSLSRTSITNIESGRQKIQIHTLLQIAAFLEVDAVDLLPQLLTNKAEATESASLEGLDDSIRKFIEGAKPKKGEDNGN